MGVQAPRETEKIDVKASAEGSLLIFCPGKLDSLQEAAHLPQFRSGRRGLILQMLFLTQL